MIDQPPKSKRRWFQFTLRTLLIAVTLAAGLLVAWRVYVEPYRRQRETMKLIEYVGSLVVDGPTGRPTEYDGSHVEPLGWWDEFWQRHFENTGQTRKQATTMLQQLLGDRWQTASLEQAEKAVAESDRDTGDF